MATDMTCLFRMANPPLKLTQSSAVTETGMHIPPKLTAVHIVTSVEVRGAAVAKPAAKTRLRAVKRVAEENIFLRAEEEVSPSELRNPTGAQRTSFYIPAIDIH